MNIKKGDKVYIAKGNDRGKTGKVERVFNASNSLVIGGIAIHKKHLKKSQKNPYGGIIDINLPVNRSNVRLICPRCEKTSKITYNFTAKTKLRICSKCGESVDESK